MLRFQAERLVERARSQHVHAGNPSTFSLQCPTSPTVSQSLAETSPPTS
jgi:hypothetical protein